MDFSRLNFLRVAAAAPELALGEPERNGQRIAAELERFRREGVALALFPELALTGYSCEDLFFSEDLLAWVLAFVAGIMVLISIDELIPSAKSFNAEHTAVMGVLVGMAVMAASLHLLG